jgi:hypothetical protein
VSPEDVSQVSEVSGEPASICHIDILGDLFANLGYATQIQDLARMVELNAKLLQFKRWKDTASTSN